MLRPPATGNALVPTTEAQLARPGHHTFGLAAIRNTAQAGHMERI